MAQNRWVRNRRIAAAVVLAAFVALGLAVHALPDSTASDVAGDALYACAIYAGLVLVAAQARPILLAAIALTWCVGVELLQLTGIPLALGTAFPPLGLVLGSGFDARDLVVYAVAVAAAWGTDAAVQRRLAEASGEE